MAECGDTPTKLISGLNSLFCRTCNQNIVLKNHLVDLHGSKAQEEGVEKDLEKFFGLKIAWDDGFPSHICRPCFLKVSKTREFDEMIKESKTQQESIGAKRGKSVGDSPSSAFSPGSKREKKGSKVSFYIFIAHVSSKLNVNTYFEILSHFCGTQLNSLVDEFDNFCTFILCE